MYAPIMKRCKRIRSRSSAQWLAIVATSFLYTINHMYNQGIVWRKRASQIMAKPKHRRRSIMIHDNSKYTDKPHAPSRNTAHAIAVRSDIKGANTFSSCTIYFLCFYTPYKTCFMRHTAHVFFLSFLCAHAYENKRCACFLCKKSPTIEGNTLLLWKHGSLLGKTKEINVCVHRATHTKVGNDSCWHQGKHTQMEKDLCVYDMT